MHGRRPVCLVARRLHRRERLAEEHAMLRGRCDHADRRERRQQQGHEVDGFHKSAHVCEACRERDDQQEREQNLHARHDHAQLARQLLEVAVKALLPRFDLGCWSRYELGGAAADLHYHTYHL